MRGGLARRAALLDRLRRQAHSRFGGAPTLTLAGADEFLPDRANPAPEKTGSFPPSTICAAYNRLGVSAGYLSPAAARWFGARGLPPTGFVRVDATPVVRRLPVTLGDGRQLAVVIVFFPPLPNRETEDDRPVWPGPPDDMLDSVLAAARSARERRDDTAGKRSAPLRADMAPAPKDAAPELVVGISPWGFQAERIALPRLAEAFHMILGAGEGAPLTAEAPEDAPSVLWSRADADGRGVIVLDVLAPPRRGQSWDPTTAAWAREIEIAPPLPANPEMERLLRQDQPS